MSDKHDIDSPEAVHKGREYVARRGDQAYIEGLVVGAGGWWLVRLVEAACRGRDQ